MSNKLLNTGTAIFIILLAFTVQVTAHQSSIERTTFPTHDYFNYITLFSDGKITRFAHMPIQVYISTVIKESPYLPEIRFAMKEWERVSDGIIQFKEIETPINADIRVNWGFSSLIDVHDTRLGSAVLTRLDDTVRTFSRSTGFSSNTDRNAQQQSSHDVNKTIEHTSNNKIKVEIILMLEGDDAIKELSQEEMRTVCLHEFGHALGLWGHSPHPGDACYPTATAQRLTERDINTLQKLYKTAIDTPQHETAITALKLEIALEPRKNYLHYLLGAVYFDKGDMEAAIDSFKECLKINENFQPAIEKLLHAYQETGQLETAIDLLQQRIKQKPSAVDHNTLGIHYYHENQVDRAIDAFERAVRLDPYHKAAKHNLHQLYREKVARALQNKDFEFATNIFDKIIQLNPMDSKSYILMGDGFALAKRYPSAIQHYQKALELNPVSRLAKGGLAHSYNNYGVQLRHSKKWDEAIDAYRKALEVQSKFQYAQINLIDVHWQKANSLRKSKQIDEAISAYLELQKLQPEETQIYSLLGELYLKKQEYTDAISAFQKVFLAEPKSLQARHNLVATYHHAAVDLLEQKKYEAAIEILKNALKIDPSQSNLRVSLSNAYQYIGDYQRAHAELENVLQNEPNNKQVKTEKINLYIRRGNEYVQNKNYSAALEQFNAIPEDQRDLVIHNIIGYLYLVQTKFSDALTVFEKVIAKDPLNKSTYLNLVSLESQLTSGLFKKNDTDKLIRTRCALSICLLKQNKFDAALTKYKEAIDDKSDTYKKILLSTGMKLAQGFQEQNDTERSATIQSWLKELNPNLNDELNDN